MGTRNLTIAYVDGEYKLAKYCQWDGYPDGQGSTILNFLKKTNLDIFRLKIKKLRKISDEEINNKWAECGATKDNFVSMEVSNKMNTKYPHLHRDMGASILKYIMAQPAGLKIPFRLNFAAESLFCEWAYVIDLDKQILEVYEGFNKKPLSEKDRFLFLQKDEKNKEEADSEYYPIRLIRSFKLSRLPQNTYFIKACEKESSARYTLNQIHEAGLGHLIPDKKYSQALKEIINKNYPVLMGIDKDLDAKIEHHLKRKNR